jgi:hypothetical protein
MNISGLTFALKVKKSIPIVAKRMTNNPNVTVQNIYDASFFFSVVIMRDISPVLKDRAKAAYAIKLMLTWARSQLLFNAGTRGCISFETPVRSIKPGQDPR